MRRLGQLEKQIATGEDSTRQFKRKIDNADSLAAEIAAFANARGGVILVGVADDGEIVGISPREVQAANQLISNAASQHIHSPIAVQTQNILLENGLVVIELTVPEGVNKPYFDRRGVIWLKVGADKRRINSREELFRICQQSSQFHADELPARATLDRLDKLLFRDFLKKRYGRDYPEAHAERVSLLQNLNLAASDGNLNLAGVLLFAEQPELVFPQFVAKGVRFPGIAVHVNRYEDSEDFAGPLGRLFKDALAFVMRNLPKVQGKNGVNSPGEPEIPELVFEELLVNALVHRDYLVSAPIRIFIFDDRVEIVSPGTLPNNLTIANIKTGNSNIRNPILISYAAKGLLPYHGIGSGIVRALEAWPEIDFDNNRENLLFRAIVRRRGAGECACAIAAEKAPENLSLRQEALVSGANEATLAPEIGLENLELHHETPVSGASEAAIAPEIAPEIASELRALLDLLAANPRMTAQALAQALNLSRRTVLYRLARLKENGLLRRMGPNKGGQWEILIPARRSGQ